MKVLVVDDEPLVRKSLSRALKSKGHDVLEAVDGLEGLKTWLAEKPELVFLDVLMPGLSGPQVLKEIGTNKTGKVILMSAYSGEHNVQTAAQIGADLFIAKPFDDIFAVVDQALRLKNG